VKAVTSHLEACLKRCVRESHDGIAARIEDVTAAHIAQHCHDLGMTQASGSRTAEKVEASRDLSCLQDRVARLEGTAAECGSLQRRHEELETLVMRIAQTTARDAAAARSKTEAEIRGLGGGVRLALDDIEARITSLKQELKDSAKSRSASDEVTVVSPYLQPTTQAQPTTQSAENVKVELREELRRELESRDAKLAWLWDLRDVATELRSLPGSRPADEARRSQLATVSAIAAATVTAHSETPPLVEALEPAVMPSCADAGAGSLLRRGPRKASEELSTEVSDVRQESPPRKGSAIENLAELLAANRSAGTNVPTQELIKAAAKELVSIRRDEKAGAEVGEELQKARTSRSESALVEDLHVKLSP
jgi:hypothetical protein